MEPTPISLPPTTQDKPSFCVGCPKREERCVIRGTWDPEARITFIAESPSWPSIGKETPLQGRNGILLRKMVKSIAAAYKLPSLRYNTAYAAGAMGKPTKEVLEKCKELWTSQWLTHFSNQLGVHVIVPLGLLAAKSAGMTAKKIVDLRGKVTQRLLGTRQVLLAPTLSLQHVYTKPGLAGVMMQDISRAVKLAYVDPHITVKSIEELSKNYVFPKTLDEVKKVCDDIIAYYDPEKQSDPWGWPITVDTETNTLKPFRRDARVLMTSFGWDDGKATAILLDHPDNNWYNPKDAWVHVARVLECPKPKVFHHMKFDLQFLERVYGYRVNNITWDTMCGEHWLAEDQKGFYGLKALAPIYAPEYQGYEEDLHVALRKGEEAAPTEADVYKEAAELAAASGSVTSTWLEGELLNEDEDEEDKDPNAKWREDPVFPESASAEKVAAYKAARDAWFKADEARDKAECRKHITAWGKLAKVMGLPKPKPVKAEKLVVKDNGFEGVAIEKLMPYAAADTDVTRMVLKKQTRKLHLTGEAQDATSVMQTLYIPASRTLGGLEFRGTKIDLNKAREYDSQLSVLLEDTQRLIWSKAAYEFNINAPVQLAKCLSSLGFETIKTTSTLDENGVPLMSTSKDVLAAYQTKLVAESRAHGQTEEQQHNTERMLSLIENLLLYRAAHKMKTSFLRRIREYAALDGHIHTTFHLTGTSTGRLSSSKLNLQNLPLYLCRITRPNPDDPDNPVVIHPGFNVKSLLVPEGPDEVFWNLDIKAAEIRVCCYYSGDKDLIKAVNDGLDIHTFFTAKIKHPELTGDALGEKYQYYYNLYKNEDVEIVRFRTAIKRVVFGTLYGAGSKKIAAQIGAWCTEEFAQNIINSLFELFPGIKQYIDDTKGEVGRTGKVRTVFGRFRRFWMAGVSNSLRAKSEREAVNFKIQSTSSDLVLAQLCEIDEHLHEIEGVLRLTVHDSMAGTIKRHRVKDMKAFFDTWLVGQVKNRFPWLPVDFLYDLEIGPSYGEKVNYRDWMRGNSIVAAA